MPCQAGPVQPQVVSRGVMVGRSTGRLAGSLPHVVSSAVSGALHVVSVRGAALWVASVVPVTAAAAMARPAARLRRCFTGAPSSVVQGTVTGRRPGFSRAPCPLRFPLPVARFLAVGACGAWGGRGVRAPGDAPQLNCRRVFSSSTSCVLRIYALRVSALLGRIFDGGPSFGHEF